MSKELLTKLDSDLKLAGYAKRSRQSYVRAVRQLYNFWSIPLHEISEEQVRAYWLHCKDELGWRSATLRISYSGIKFFFKNTLKRDWDALRLISVKRHKAPPAVLTVDEVRKVLRALPNQMNHVFYVTIYSLGLRLGEARQLTISDIDSAAMCVRIRDGKGGKGRTIPLAGSVLVLLREWWKSHRNPKWVFPAPGRSGELGPTATACVSEATVQGALRRTVKKLRLKKHIHAHTFRHSYATHMLEAGVPIQHVQQYLGHTSLVTTMIYLHITETGKCQSRTKLDLLMRGVLS